MPNRIIKESIKRSPEIDSLSWFDEVVFYRMIVTADDYGRLDGRPIVLRNDLFPTKETITKKAIEDAVSKLVSVGLLASYVDAESNMPYLCFPKWEKHQIIRNKHSRYPAPPDDLIATCKQLRADCKQMISDCMSESESESNIESESNHHDDTRVNLNTVEAYATSNLQAMSAGNMQEFASYKDDMSEDLIRFAIDEACAAGAPRWSYVRSILQTYERDGIKTVGDAKAAKEKRKGKPKDWHNPAQDYDQREYKNEDYGDDFFFDAVKEYGGTT